MAKLKDILWQAYYDLCREHDVAFGSPEAFYLWQEYIADVKTLDILSEVESTGMLGENLG
jgi:hypothetical protein